MALVALFFEKMAIVILNGAKQKLGQTASCSGVRAAGRSIAA